MTAFWILIDKITDRHPGLGAVRLEGPEGKGRKGLYA